MGLDMKKFFVVISLLIGSLFYSASTAIAKNDTVIISNEYKAMKFNACFSTEFCNHAKSDISKIILDCFLKISSRNHLILLKLKLGSFLLPFIMKKKQMKIM